MPVYAVMNEKGGSAKTATAVNLGASLAEAGRSVLVIDLDPQGDATRHFGVEPFETGGIADHLKRPRDLSALMVEVNRRYDGVIALVPASRDLLNLDLGQKMTRYHALRRCLDTARREFDTVFVDCPPSFGLLAQLALTAADGVLIPVTAEGSSLDGVARMQENVDDVREAANADLAVFGVAVCRSKHTRLSSDVAAALAEEFGRLLFETQVPENVRVSESHSHGVPVIEHDTGSPGAAAYRALAQEFIRREKGEQRGRKG